MIKKFSWISVFVLLFFAPLNAKDFQPYISIKGQHLQAKYNFSYEGIEATPRDSQLGFLPALGVRYKFMRAELQYEKQKYNDDAETITYAGMSIPYVIPDIKLDKETIMLNVFFDWLIEEENGIYLYFGAGAGQSKLKSKISILPSDSKNSFSWALYAGFAAKVDTPNWPLFLDLGYRYVNTKGWYSNKFTEQGITFGFRYMF